MISQKTWLKRKLKVSQLDQHLLDNNWSFIDLVDLSNIHPTTELEKKLLAMLHSADERYSELKSQFENYQTMVKKTFLDNIIDDTRR